MKRMKKQKKLSILIGLWICLWSVWFYPKEVFGDSDVQNVDVIETDWSWEENPKSIQRLLQIAIQPLGRTMYVWGGGWNQEDTAAGTETRSIGVSERWEDFYRKQNRYYDFNQTRYQIHNGLDCSGYVGWTIYNLFHRNDGEEGYVMKAQKMAKDFANRGWGNFTPAKRVKDFRPGDIMSSKAHVYIVLGACEDGSILLLHSSPPGVQINGTVNVKGDRKSQAAKLADHYMKKYYPQWYQRYKPKTLDKSYLKSYAQMRWRISDSSVISDEEGIREMKADEVLKTLFEEEEVVR